MRMASVFAQRWHSWLRELQITLLTHDALAALELELELEPARVFPALLRKTKA